MEDNVSPIEILKQKKPWIHENISIRLACSVSLQRNLEKFKFPNKLDIERKKQIVALVGKDLLKIEHLVQPQFFKSEDLSALQKEYLTEHFLTATSFNQSGPGDAFLIDDSGELLISLNLSDHLSFHKLDSRGDLESAWQHLVKIETALGTNLSYSLSPKFGFLTANFDQCGTALSATIFLHLPALLHLEKLDSVLEKKADESMYITGIQGSPTEIIGDIVAIQNNYTLGLTEESIISSVRSLSSKLVMEEKNARDFIRETQNPEIIDRVSRSFGILLYSYQIEAIEALNALSLCKLGAIMGWIEGISENELNTIFFNCRRSHLLSLHPDQSPNQEEIPHMRALFIHQALKNAKLLV